MHSRVAPISILTQKQYIAEHWTDSLYTEAQKISKTLWLSGGIVCYRILMYLLSVKYDKTSKHFTHHKKLLSQLKYD